MPHPTFAQTVPPPFPRHIAVIILLCMGCAFGGNHVAARVAFDDGAGVLLAILMRSGGTLLALATLVVLYGTGFIVLFISVPRLNIPRNTPVMNIVPLATY